MTTQITFLGVAGYDVEGPDYRVLVDPCLSINPAAPYSADEVPAPDIILVSHAAIDHFGDAAAIAHRTGAPVVCGADVRELLLEQGLPPEQIQATCWGIVVEVGGIVVRPVECHHWSHTHLASGHYISGVPLGFIVEPEPGVRIYHYGDTAIFGDLRLIGELYRPTIGILGCAQPRGLLFESRQAGRELTGEMSPGEAALAAEMLGVDIAVASHYLDPSDPDVQEFLAQVDELDSTGKRKAVAPAAGQTLIVDGSNITTEERGRNTVSP